METSAWIALAVSIILAAVFVCVGLHARQIILNGNPCQMTYAMRDKSEVSLCGGSCPYKLWKISNPKNKNLNAQPVLFIPGHLGSAIQARSLASQMHNKDVYFQYFALDFLEGYSAFHGSDVLAQAAILNKALTKIVDLYAKSGITLGADITDSTRSSSRQMISNRKIMIVGHSIGGMVARAGLLLSNHPSNCVVSDIVQLSSPNLRAPFVPDASLDVTYDMINRAWSLVHQNQTYVQQTLCSRLLQHTSPPHTTNTSLDLNATTGGSSRKPLQFGCPACISSTRILSISGGVLDAHVQDELTPLHSLFPPPPPPTAAVTATTNGATAGGTAARWWDPVNFFYASVQSLLVHPVQSILLPMLGLGRTNSNDSHGSGGSGSGSGGGDTTLTKTNSSSNSSAHDDAPAVTTTAATATTTTTAPPAAAAAAAVDTVFNQGVQHLSIRTSQLGNVGFPIDHAAVVWCYELLRAVTQSMRALATVQQDESKATEVSTAKDTTRAAAVNWTNIFPTVATAANNQNSPSLSQLQLHQQHEQRILQWQKAGLKEQAYIQSKLSWTYVQSVPLDYVQRFLAVRVVVCYLIISALVLSAPLLRLLTGNAVINVTGVAVDAVLSSHWLNMHPWHHWGMEILCAALFGAVHPLLPPPLMPHTFSVLLQVVTLAIVARVCYDLSFGTLDSTYYLGFLYWIISYLLALLLRMCMLLVLSSVRWVTQTTYRSGRSLARATIWNQAVRRAVRQGRKALAAMGKMYVPYYEQCLLFMQYAVGPCVVLALVLTICFQTAQDRLYSRSVDGTGGGIWAYVISVSVLVVYALLVAGLLLLICAPPVTVASDNNTSSSPPSSSSSSALLAEAERNCFQTDLCLMYIPLPLLAYPTAAYTYRLLYAPFSPFHTASSLYSVFDGGRIVYVAAIGAVSLHLWVLRGQSSLLNGIKPLRWMQEMMGPYSVRAYRNVFGHSAAATAAKRARDREVAGSLAEGEGARIHEDGGKYAIYAAVPEDESQEHVAVANGVIMGSTYKVVSCACHRDFLLKDPSEWCSWCRCNNKHLPPSYRYNSDSGSNTSVDAYYSSLDLDDFGLDLLPFMGLLASIWFAYNYVSSSPYQYVYCLGFIAVSFLAREIPYSIYGSK